MTDPVRPPSALHRVVFSVGGAGPADEEGFDDIADFPDTTVTRKDRRMTPTEIADVLDQAGNDAVKLAHDIRQRLAPDYSSVDKEHLTPVETARVKAVGEVITPVMDHVFNALKQAPPAEPAPQTSVPEPSTAAKPEIVL